MQRAKKKAAHGKTERFRQKPHSQVSESNLKELFERCARHWPEFAKLPLFDVGANIGQSYEEFRAHLPQTPIHCFEPAPETFARLETAAQGDENTSLHALALGLGRGQIRFSKGLDTGNRRLAQGERTAEVSVVEMTTGDHFCAAQKIPQIGFLKVDTEGHDLDVLAGFSHMLRERRIAAIQVECATSLDNRFHVHLERFIHFLHPFGYRLSDLMEPHRRVNVTKQNLRGIWFANAIFMLEVEAPKLRRDGRN